MAQDRPRYMGTLKHPATEAGFRKLIVDLNAATESGYRTLNVFPIEGKLAALVEREEEETPEQQKKKRVYASFFSDEEGG